MNVPLSVLLPILSAVFSAGTVYALMKATAVQTRESALQIKALDLQRQSTDLRLQSIEIELKHQTRVLGKLETALGMIRSRPEDRHEEDS